MSTTRTSSCSPTRPPPRARSFFGSRERARNLGDADEAYYLVLLGENEFWGCRYDEAARYAEEGVQLSRQTGRPVLAYGALQVIALVQALRGELDESRETAEEALDCAASPDPATAADRRRCAQLIAFSRGDLAEAIESFAASESYFVMKDPALRPLVPSYAEALVAVGRIDEARALLNPYEQLARTLDRAVNLAGALRSRALLCAAERDYSTAEATFEEGSGPAQSSRSAVRACSNAARVRLDAARATPARASRAAAGRGRRRSSIAWAAPAGPSERKSDSHSSAAGRRKPATSRRPRAGLPARSARAI